jgi:amino acid transporter
VYSFFKRLLLGRPIATEEQEHQRLPKTIALATFSSDPISSSAYATEEILFVTAVGTSSLALGLDVLMPMAIAVAILLAIVVTSYRQTMYAYPKGSGAYIVSRENLGRLPSLVAGASLLLDYILSVAVATSAGAAAIISIPALESLGDQRVALCLGFIAVLMLGNLRGLKESAKVFAAPTYVYIVGMGVLIGIGLWRSYNGDVGNVVPPELDQEIALTGGSLGLFLILRGFSSGAVALSGIEALADGVPAFRKPQAKNAAITLTVMAGILGTLFFGLSLLASRLHPYPSHHETVISQLARTVFGTGAMHTFLQLATAGILVLAANTAFADFPRLSSIIARDGFLPRQFANRGDRLVFSNGIVFLALAASTLIIAFGGITTQLIPLYAVGVFMSFTLSQAGMVMHHRRLKEPGWRRNTALNAFGSFATASVLIVVAITKFAVGAWLPIAVVPAIVLLLSAIRRHYDRVNAEVEIAPEEVRPERLNHTVVVLVGRIHKGVLKALAYARSLRPQHLVALYVSFEDEDRKAIEEQWERYNIDVALEIVPSPYREIIAPIETFLDELDARWNNDTITVIIPEFVVEHWYEHLLHNQSALFLKGKLLFREGTVVTSVPYHVRGDDGRGDEGA